MESPSHRHSDWSPSPESSAEPDDTVEARISSVTALACDAFGEDIGRNWLQTPLRRFDQRTPLSLAGSPEGYASVKELIMRVQHGFNA